MNDLSLAISVFIGVFVGVYIFHADPLGVREIDFTTCNQESSHD